MSFRIFVVSVLGLLLASCSFNPSVKNDYVLSRTSGKGLLLASVSYSGAFALYRVSYRKVGGGEGGTLSIGDKVSLMLPAMYDWHMEKKGLRGKTFAVDLAAGEYEIYSWSVGSGRAHIKPGREFALRFRIEPGKATYLGNFHFTRTARSGPMITAVDVTQSNMASRDLPIIEKHVTSVDPEHIHIGVGETVKGLGGANDTNIGPIIVPVY